MKYRIQTSTNQYFLETYTSKDVLSNKQDLYKSWNLLVESYKKDRLFEWSVGFLMCINTDKGRMYFRAVNSKGDIPLYNESEIN